jgi:hypothetical protein
MQRKALVSVWCVFLILSILGSCGNPANSVLQDNLKNREKPAGQDSGETSDPDQSAPDDPDNGEDPDNDSGDEDVPEDDDAAPDDGDGDDPDSGDDPDNDGDSEAGAGQGGAEEPGVGNQPGSGDGPSSGDSPGGGDDPGGGWEGAVVLTDAAALQAYLDGQPGNTAANPYRVKVEGINLGSTGAGNALKGLYLALSRYVALDFSGSYGEEFGNVTPKTAVNKDKITEILLPSGLHTITVNAFAGCSELVVANVSGATTLYQGSFKDCVKLETVIMDEVTALKNTTADGNGAFYNCDSLVSVSLPKATEIGKKTFNSCGTLSTVYAPQVTIIGDNAFAGCKNLASLTLGETPPELGNKVFASGKPEAIYVPSSSVSTYKNTEVAGWTDALKAKVRALP